MHGLWHVAVLGVALLAAAGGGILAISLLVFEEPPPGLVRARPAILALLGAAVVLMAVEWTAVH